MLALSDDFDGPWCRWRVRQSCSPCPPRLEPLVDYYRAIAVGYPDWAEYRSAMTAQGKALIRITPERWGPISTADSRLDVA